MRRVNILWSVIILLTMVLAACGPKATPTAIVTEPPATEPATEVPAATETATGAEPTPTLVPINLAGPEMAVGSTFLYRDGSTLVAVPGGPFLMGRGGGTDNPQHEVTVGDFWIYRTEVTNQQYLRCMKFGACSSPDLEDNQGLFDRGRQNDPVSGVTWDQSQAYCEWVHGRLPTEAEWEKTAAWDDEKKAHNIYPWGDAAPTCALLNFNNCFGKTTTVTTYPQGQSFYEAYDMSGNAFEWVADWYDAQYYKTSPGEDPAGPDTGNRRSIRSGGYKSNQDQVPSAVRFFDNPNTHSRDRGFRCVVEDPTYFAPYCEQALHYGMDGNGNPPPGGGGDLVCPDPWIEHGGDCVQGNTAVSFVTVHVPAPSVVSVITGLDAPGCNPGGNTAETVNQCGIGIHIHVEATCSAPPPGPPSCPPGTDMAPDGTHCISQGGPGDACPDGYELDPVLHCCSALEGIDDIHCAIGFSEDSDGNCTADVYGVVPPNPADLITFLEGSAVDGCGTPDQECDPEVDPTCDDPRGCTNPPNPNQCPYGVNYETCTCNPFPSTD
jgi:formylglycine-generating enzyme required for sulfatase activity